MKFLTKEHENKVVNLLQSDGTHQGDMERLALFYIVAGNTDLYTKVNCIYNFAQHQIEPDCLHDTSVDFCSSSRSLLKLAYNLYNGYQEENNSFVDLLAVLDADNFHLATESMKIRFGYSKQVQSTLDDDELEL